jgi:ABC-2 type transport system ATP-binding protein
MAEHRRGATILLSTHVMVQAEELCEHVVMIHQGRKVLDERMADLRRRYHARTVLFEARDPSVDPAVLSRVPGVERVEAASAGFRISLSDGLDPSEGLRRLAGAVPAVRVELSRLRLEDLFVDIVTGRGDADAGTTLREQLAETGAEVTG